ncbi:hypothetical protein DFJ73DRAFT_807042 [Zopfochytrium polystomum]|nr:hypothetical protein DFJ73DRAFT_807042 [Zopfochytrium polystomum]
MPCNKKSFENCAFGARRSCSLSTFCFAHRRWISLLFSDRKSRERVGRMGRKEFLADRKAVIAFYCDGGSVPTYMKNVKGGDDDGSVVARFKAPGTRSVEFSIVITNVESYPTSSTGFIFVTSDDSDDIGLVVEGIDLTASRLQDIIQKLETKLVEHFKLPAPKAEESASNAKEADVAEGSVTEPEDEEMSDAGDHDGSDDEDEEYEEDDDGEDGYESDGMLIDSGHASGPLPHLRKVVRRDMQELKAHGISSSVLHHEADEGFILAMSVPISQLAFNEIFGPDTLDAWNLSSEHFLLLLIKFGSVYVDRKNLENMYPKPEFRMFVSPTPKLAVEDAFVAFRTMTANKVAHSSSEGSHPGRLFQDFLMSWTMADLLNTRFLSLLNYRIERGVNWAGAEYLFSNARSTLNQTLTNEILSKAIHYDDREEKEVGKTLHMLVSHVDPREVNFPLSVMLYSLRRLHLAPKYCLVCHKRTEIQVESLRPYICDSTLCTFQYLQVGIGPKIEQELLHNPSVVELLISFAVCSVPLSPFPSGVGYNATIVLEGTSGHITGWDGASVFGDSTNWLDGFEGENAVPLLKDDILEIRVDKHLQFLKVKEVLSNEHLLLESPPRSPLQFKYNGVAQYLVHRKDYFGFSLNPGPEDLAKETALFASLMEKMPSVPVMANELRKKLGMELMELPPEKEPDIIPDTVEEIAEEEEEEKEEPIDPLLLPPQEQSYRVSSLDISLRPFLDSIDKLLYPLLRWIIGSNRGYIKELTNPAEMIANVPTNYKQFRFVMGSPEKEAKFLSERAQVTEKKFQTIYAFHGSPNGNWHSIIRTGLNFKKVLHGRAYGDGIYHGLELSTSQGYARSSAQWKNRTYAITSAISVNEIINLPEKFRSSNPYLVVQYENWVQTRYLLVGTDAPLTAGLATTSDESAPYIPLDPARAPKGMGQQAIGIPVGRAQGYKLSNWRANHAVFAEGLTDDEDEEVEIPVSAPLPKAPPAAELDLSSMPPPSYATTSATKAILKELRQLIRLQEAQPADQRGWTIDLENISNLYQWQIRLVAFDKSLPLAKDLVRVGMYEEGLTLEIRFGPQHPFTPPFIRVVKPRLLQFINGGGGHVTAGGSICMDLLTNTNWSPSYTVEAALLQVRMAICSLDPKPARLDHRHDVPYSASEAISAFVRVAQAHGWEVPPGWDKYFGS